MLEETKGSTAWFRFTKLMIDRGYCKKAEESHEILLKQTSDESGKVNLFHQLAQAKYLQVKQEETIKFYEKSIEIHQKTSSLKSSQYGCFL